MAPSFRKPNMVYNEGAKFWVSNVDDYDYKIEYLKFEEGTPFPEEIHRRRAWPRSPAPPAHRRPP